ncbi:hypothetical protein L6164_018194 [Bauhinia variegata]|uniref:Uncharacterized protein n=1 Tax=Bauhinia variegata TaxID=167791 RepID=A0ACB9NBM3_BAUVA|nr:hypothetical protein L6164_018194 [Bauhinia variegata]
MAEILVQQFSTYRLCQSTPFIVNPSTQPVKPNDTGNSSREHKMVDCQKGKQKEEEEEEEQTVTCSATSL